MGYKVINAMENNNCDKLGLMKMSENKFRKSTNFSIEHILMKKCETVEQSENDKIDLTCKRLDMISNLNLKASNRIYRPLNKVLDSPWCSRGPLIFNPKILLRTSPVNIKEERSLESPSPLHNFSYAQDFRYESLRATETVVYPNSLDELAAGESPATNQATTGPFKCTNCDKTFDGYETLRDHEKCHKIQRFECSECGKFFSQLRNYKYHLSVHRGTKEYAANCTVCGKMFNDKGYLSSHMKIHRNKKEYQCSYCPKSFNQRVAYNMHVRIHTGVKPHKCECGKRFSRKMLLKQHLRTHTGEKPYQCSVCLKTFADRSNMILHHRLHSGIKPFSCDICPKSFTKKHHLTTHLNYHNGFKPYICPHPNCGQSFTQSSNMRTHAKKCQHKNQS